MWIVVGFALGFLVAWWFPGLRSQSTRQANHQLNPDMERDFSRLKKELETEQLAHQSTKRELAECLSNSGLPVGQDSSGIVSTNIKAEQPSVAAEVEESSVGGGTSLADDIAPEPAADDLTKIKGIGRVLQGKLNGFGINSFQQVADFTSADIARIDALLAFPGRIVRDRWVEQAQTIVSLRR